MLSRLVLVSLLVGSTQAFAPAPIRWGGPGGTKLVSADKSGKVVVRDQSASGDHAIPYFSANPDNTISWDAKGMCLEAIGTKHGDAIRVNHCTGKANQKFDWSSPAYQQFYWKPWGRIQLKDTDQCLDVVGDGDGAPIQLQSCVDRDSESWKFGAPEDPSPFPEIDTSTRYAMNFWPAFLGLSLTAWLWQVKSRGAAATPDQGGVALTTSFDQGARNMVPAMMAVSPIADENGGKEASAEPVARANVQMQEGKSESGLMSALTKFNNLFAVWLAIAAVAAIKVPASFLWVKTSYFTTLLASLMFSVGVTTTIDDFKACFDRPGAVAINFVSCYGIMPAVAYALAKAIGADGPTLAGLVLVGSVNGGQASNLCTLIAGGDVALSVLMTTSTTLGCIFMTPLICKLVLGSVVPIDTVGIIVSAFQVVLAPIFAGVAVNQMAPKFCAKLSKYTPTVGILATVAMVGGSVAKCAAPILGAGLKLQAACAGLHLFGGMLGYWLTQFFKFDVRTCRTVAIETAMKSSAFGFVLASMHFGSFGVRVPSAVSVVWMAVTGSALAVFWQKRPPTDAAPASA